MHRWASTLAALLRSPFQASGSMIGRDRLAQTARTESGIRPRSRAWVNQILAALLRCELRIGFLSEK